MEDGLEGRQESESLPWGEVVGHDNLLQVFVGEVVDISLSGKPAPETPVCVLDAALLLGRIGVTEPGDHIEHVAQQGMAGKSGVIVQSNGFPEFRIEAAKDGHGGCSAYQRPPSQRGLSRFAQ